MSELLVGPSSLNFLQAPTLNLSSHSFFNWEGSAIPCHPIVFYSTVNVYSVINICHPNQSPYYSCLH